MAEAPRIRKKPTPCLWRSFYRGMHRGWDENFSWPPFLLGVIYRKQARWIRVAFEAFIQNLPHLD
jgi:hypothetical protein